MKIKANTLGNLLNAAFGVMGAVKLTRCIRIKGIWYGEIKL